jgi:hypothetical protein
MAFMNAMDEPIEQEESVRPNCVIAVVRRLTDLVEKAAGESP